MLSLAQTGTAPTSQPTSPAWYSMTFAGNPAWKWVALLGVLIATFVAGKILSYVLIRQGRWLSQRKGLGMFGRALELLSGPASLLIFAAGLYIGSTFLNLVFIHRAEEAGKAVYRELDLRGPWVKVCQTIAALAVGWAVYRLVELLEAFLRRRTVKTRSQLDDQIVPLVRKALRLFLVVLVALFIAQSIYQWDVGAMIAGLGLGGLAFALAAQDALKNLFGSITIFADRPFQMGEWVKIAEFEGIVEEVGFRSTRVRTFFGHLVTIPNATVASSPVENVGRRPYIRRNLNVTVTYDTPPEKLRRGIAILQEMLQARKQRFPEDRPPRVYFSDFNAASLNILVVYWFVPPDWWEFNAFNHDFNMELLQRFNEEGIEFAFPTQTLYLKQGSAPPGEISLSAGASGPKDA